MISCPAAKQIRWVNPSMATVAPSRTSSATASRIVATFEASAIGRFRGTRLDAELVALGIAHDYVRVEPLDGPPSQALQAGHLLVHRGQGPKVQVQSVLRRL